MFCLSPSKKPIVFHSKSIENPQLQTISSQTIQTTPPEMEGIIIINMERN